MKGLREKRLELGLTQVEVAVKCEVSLVTYLTWERNVGNPNPENLAKLEKVLGKVE